MDFILKYFWVVSIIVMLINIPLLKLRAAKEIERDPTRAPGYNKLIIGSVSVFIIHFLLMGIVSILWNVDFMEVMRTDNKANIFTVLFYGVSIIEAIILVVWVWFLGGAAFLAEYRHILSLPKQPTIIKLIAAALGVWSIFNFIF